jgi:uncharacterized membrane protein YhaH (DUF805 family)
MEAIMNWVLEVFNKYAEFNGRARRKEYWYFYLFNFIVSIVISVIGQVMAYQSDNESTSLSIIYSVVVILYSLILVLPQWAVTVRRLHDTNRSGWWILIQLIPIIGAIITLIYLIEDSTPGDNQYGPNPKAELEQVT